MGGAAGGGTHPADSGFGNVSSQAGEQTADNSQHRGEQLSGPGHDAGGTDEAGRQGDVQGQGVRAQSLLRAGVAG